MTIPSILKKYLMALSGFVMVAFVFVHMAGNLAIFKGAEAINAYAHFLQTLPPVVLWGFRGFLALSVLVHVWMAILITRENRRARPHNYKKTETVQAGVASKTMGISGSIMLAFIIFHLLHFTVHVVYPEYKDYMAYINNGSELLLVHDVYGMMITGFSHLWVAVFYIVAMAMLCLHLSHGVTSMFQTLGWRNAKWKKTLDNTAKVYGLVIFFGFISIPLAVVANVFDNNKETPVLDVQVQSLNVKGHSR